MDHVINALKGWLETFEEHGDRKAIRCIKAAIAELQRYYD